LADVSAERVHDLISTREMLARDAALLTDSVREAGALALSLFRTELKNWTKGASSPVSEADIRVNDLLESRLRSATPDYGWLSEESVDDDKRLGKRLTWIVDPIDGTRAYISGRADWSISVALAENGVPQLCALYAPVTDEMFMAARGQGATRNGARMTAVAGGGLAGARLAGPKRYLDRLSHLDLQIAVQPKIHSLALRLTRAAQGKLDAAFSSGGSHDWDLAAADLLVHEAGGVMTDFAGRGLVYNRPHLTHPALIAAGRALHATLVDLVRGRMAEFA
jgi:myo-inositol-1(or 4)-monophosphatase